MANPEQQFKDVALIKHSPAYGNCLKWSDDSMMAVASESLIYILNPGRIDDTRSISAFPGKTYAMISAPGNAAYNDTSLVHFDMAVSKAINLSSNPKDPPIVRSIDWSPMGCSSGGCALAACSDDHQVFIFGRTTTVQSEWTAFVSPSDMLLEYLNKTDWAAADIGPFALDAVAGYQSTTLLRLRGGARSKMPAKRSNVIPEEKNPVEHNKQQNQVGDIAAPHKDFASTDHGNHDDVAIKEENGGGGGGTSSALTSGRLSKFQEKSIRKKEAAYEAVRRFFSFRRDQPRTTLPRYSQPSEHLKGVDKEQIQKMVEQVWQESQEDLVRDGLTKQTYQAEVMRILRESWDRVKNIVRDSYKDCNLGIPGEELALIARGSNKKREDSAAADGDGGGDGGEDTETENEEEIKTEKGQKIPGGGRGRGRGRGGSHRGRGRKIDASAQRAGTSKEDGGEQGQVVLPGSRDLFVVPEGFKWTDLPPVDVRSDYMMKQSMSRGAVRRFFYLRNQEPAHELPNYAGSKKPVTKGLDLWLIHRVTTEYMTAHAPAMHALGMNAEKFKKYWLENGLKKVWDKSTGRIDQSAFSISIDAADGLSHPPSEDNAPPPLPLKISGQQTTKAKQLQEDKAKKASTIAGRKPRKSEGASQTANKAFEWPTHEVLNVDFQKRLYLVSTQCVSWSPVVHAASGERVAVLALGTKAGRVWLYRFVLPSTAGYPAEAAKETEQWKERLSLIGWIDPGHGVTWSTALAWTAYSSKGQYSADSLILAIGDSEGRVTLWKSQADIITNSHVLYNHNTGLGGTIQQQQQQQGTGDVHLHSDASWSLFVKLATIVQPDLRSVQCLDMSHRYVDTSSNAESPVKGDQTTEIVVAIGKTGGCVYAWRSGFLTQAPPFLVSPHVSSGPKSRQGEDIKMKDAPCTLTDDVINAAIGAGRLISPRSIRGGSDVGYQTITGISLACGGELVVAASRQGVLASWRMPVSSHGNMNGVHEVLSPLDLPVPLKERRLPKEVGIDAFGLDVSPGGLFICVSRNSLPDGFAYNKQLQLHHRINTGLVHLYRLAGPQATISDLIGAMAIVCKHWVSREAPSTAMWDIIHLLMVEKEETEEAELFAKCIFVAEQFEKSFYATLAARELSTRNHGNNNDQSLQQDGESDFPECIPDVAWRSLKVAVTLRRIVSNLALYSSFVPSMASMAPSNPVEDKMRHGNGVGAAALPAGHAEAIQRSEMFLLQRRLYDILKNVSGEIRSIGYDGWPAIELLAADAVFANIKNDDIFERLSILGTRAYLAAGETAPGEHNSFAITQRPCHPSLSTAVTVAMNTGGAASILCACFRDKAAQEEATLSRCPYTLQTDAGEANWKCRLCRRSYHHPPGHALGGVGGTGDPFECVMCAGVVGHSGPDFAVIPPCLY